MISPPPRYEADEDPPPADGELKPLLDVDVVDVEPLLLVLPTTLLLPAAAPPLPAFAPPPPLPPFPPPPGPAFCANAGPATRASPATNIAVRRLKDFMRPPTG